LRFEGESIGKLFLISLSALLVDNVEWSEEELRNLRAG